MFKKVVAGSLTALAFWLKGKQLAEFNFEAVKNDMEKLSGVKGVRDVHVWRKERRQVGLAAHIIIEDFSHREAVQTSLKAMLANRYDIAHSTLEFETVDCEGNCS